MARAKPSADEARRAARSQILPTIATEVLKSRGATELFVPTTQALITATGVGQYNINRAWPAGRESMVSDILFQLISYDPYSSKDVKENSEAAIARAVENPEGSTLSKRERVVTALGRTVISATDHLYASRLASVVESRAEESRLHIAFYAAQAHYHDTVTDLLSGAHSLLGDEIKNPDPYNSGAPYQPYARALIGLATGYAMNHLSRGRIAPEPPLVPNDNLLNAQFMLVADHYTIPAR